jgi:hypothetical protein
MIAGKEVHEGMKIGHLRSLLVSGLAVRRCDLQQKMLGVVCGGGLKLLPVNYRIRFSGTVPALTARRVRAMAWEPTPICQPAALLRYKGVLVLRRLFNSSLNPPSPPSLPSPARPSCLRPWRAPSFPARPLFRTE